MKFRPIWITLLTAIFLGSHACGAQNSLEGRYRTENSEQTEFPAVTLELAPNGKGVWATAEDNAPFRWEGKNGEVWLHTDTGGVIVGKIDGDAIVFSLPQNMTHRFKKVKN